ncbi:MAG TPA: TonB-dependent receptor [Terriglobia bacterium]|nr:TonB-dependent receptor [Terriglobia bacterium]
MRVEVGKQKSEVESQKKAAVSSAGSSRFHGLRISTIFLGALWLSLGAAASRAATIRGTVFDPSGHAVPDAQVTLLPQLASYQERRTDAHGEYEFDGLLPGAYRLVATAPGFTTSVTAFTAAERDTRTVDLQLRLSALEQQVVVSASLESALAPQIGSSVSVVTRRDIQDRDAQNVLDILRGVPGVEVERAGRLGGVTGVFIRGGNSNYNLVMIDGIQLNQFGGDFDFASLTADGVARVEVTRGPESALYGSNAVTGVVNIVTERGDGPPHFSLLEEVGSFSAWRVAAGGSGLAHGIGWAVNVDRLYSAGVVSNDQYRNQTAFFSLNYSRSPRRQASFHLIGNANDAGAPGAFGSDPDHLFPGLDLISRDKQNLFGYEGSYAEQFSPRFRQVVTGNVATNDYYFRSPFGDSYSNNLRGVFDTRSEIAVSSTDSLVAGFEYNREQVKDTFIANAAGTPFLLPRTSLAYFAEDRWNPGRRWFVTAGARLDDIRTHSLPPDAFGVRPLLPANSVNQISPRLAVAYVAREDGPASQVLGATRLHSSFGTGIRAPDGFELAFTNNPRLKPERSASFDAGVEQQFFGGRAALDVTYFENHFKDQIVVLGGSLTNLSTFSSDNLARSQARGVEVSLRARPTPSLQFTAEYTRLDSAILALDGATLAESPFTVGQPLIRRPKNSAFYNVTWQHRRLTLNTDAYIRGATLDLEPNDGTFACAPVTAGGPGLPCLFTNSGYVAANAGFSYGILRGLEVYGRLNNFLNRKYEEVFGFPALHLNFLAGIRYSFPAE